MYRMQLTILATRRTPHGASRVGAGKMFAWIGESPTCSVTAFCRNARVYWSYDYDHSMASELHPLPAPSPIAPSP